MSVRMTDDSFVELDSLDNSSILQHYAFDAYDSVGNSDDEDNFEDIDDDDDWDDDDEDDWDDDDEDDEDEDDNLKD